MAVDVAVADPAAMLARWSQVFGLDADSAATTLALGYRQVRFVLSEGRSGIVAVDLRAVDRASAGEGSRRATFAFVWCSCGALRGE